MAKDLSLWFGLWWIMAVNAADKSFLRSQPRLLSEGCPSGFSLLSGSSTLCVKVMPTAKEYPAAQQDCRSIGSELVSITSSQENYALASLISGQTFVGGAQDSEGRWYWNDHQPFTYTNWGYGQPDNTWGYEDCLAILPTGLWNDYICWFELPSVCGVRLMVATMSPVLSPTPYPSSLPGDSSPGSSSSSSSSNGFYADPFAMSIISIVVLIAIVLSCIAVRLCCRSSTSAVYTSPPPAVAVPYSQPPQQAMPTTVAVVSSAPSAPPLAEAFTDSSKAPTASAVVALPCTSSGRGSIELPLVASAPSATVAYAASVPDTPTVLPTTVTTTSATGLRPVTMSSTGPITTNGQPAYVYTITYV